MYLSILQGSSLGHMRNRSKAVTLLNLLMSLYSVDPITVINYISSMSFNVHIVYNGKMSV